MGRIVILDENTVNKIAAGEVIERPSSVVKELIENSIDAGASSINIEIRSGGISYIKVIDNGLGIEEDDVEIAFESHATSKIRNVNDLDSVKSMGFRGEALSSIAAVSAVILLSRTASAPSGLMVEVRGGNVLDVKPSGCPIGTSITVKDLFFNTPARFKFLKKDTAEAGSISEIISREALGNPKISFKLVSGGATVLHTPGNGDLLSTIFSIYGKEVANSLYKVEYRDERTSITGYVGKPEISRSNRNQQSIFINRRYVKSKLISAAVDEAYKTFLMKNRYALFVLNMELNPQLVDVNVHPSKMEVKFASEQDVFRSALNAVSSALLSQAHIRNAEASFIEKNTFRMSQSFAPISDYEQQKIDIRGEVASSVSETNSEKQNEEREHLNLNAKEEGALYKSDISKIEDSVLIGQAFSTYIFLQQGDELLIIDQHAAHERIMYEELIKRYSEKGQLSQPLLSPIQIELTYREIKLLDDEKEFFELLGYSFECFGINSVILRSVPYNSTDGNIKEIFLAVLDLLARSGRIEKLQIADELLYMMACKSAVKANNKLDGLEIAKLIESLSKVKNPYTCPHGRPSIIKLKKYELEKLFKRIV